MRFLGLMFGIVIVSYLLAQIVARIPALLDPVSQRSNHNVPVSRGGGIGIFFLVSVLIIVLSLTTAMPLPPIFVGCAALAALLGAVDDVRGLPAMPKLLVLLGLSILAVMATGGVTMVPLPLIGMVSIPAWLGLITSAFFLLAFVNAFNFMDGLNGMAGAMGTLGLALICYFASEAPLSLLLVTLVIAAALYGFTIRNILAGHPFLGDAGSLGLGFFIAAAALYLGAQDPAAFYVIMLSYLPYFIDTGVTLMRRGAKRKRLFDAHKEHFYQRLRTKGWSHDAVAMAYFVMGAAIAAITLLATQLLGTTGYWLAGVLAVALYGAVIRAMFKRGEPRMHEPDRSTPPATETPANR